MRKIVELTFVILLVVGVPAAAKPRCDEAIAKHVYNPGRLTVVARCVEVTGTLVDATAGRRKDGVRHEADGDPHGWLRLDPGQAPALLNDGNRRFENGNLVYEVVCAFPVTQEDAKAACAGYVNKVKLLPVGTHVAITGVLVREQNHGRWMEIHPVSRIERR